MYFSLISSWWCFGVSAVAHSFHNTNELIGTRLFQLDRAMILFMFAVKVTAAWMVHMQYEPLGKQLMSFLLCSSVGAGCIYNIARTDLPKWATVALLALQGSLSAYPLLTETFLRWRSEPRTLFKIWSTLFTGIASALVGAYMYATQFPERTRPCWGRCDVVGQGHNIMHVLSFMATLCTNRAIKLLCEMTSPHNLMKK